ncbi:MAG TPA: penicillin-binding protein activator [Candidatus Saccharimonadales bacterium]|nr:penicillin-binding protein activator [Candidatus Saccharimonadales bacterium]
MNESAPGITPPSKPTDTNTPETTPNPSTSAAPSSPTSSAPAASATGSKKPLVWVAVAVAVIALAVGGYFLMKGGKAKPVVATRTVKVGIFEDLTGDNATVGSSFKEGVEMAHQHFSDPGLTVQLVTTPTLCDSTKAAQAVKDLVTKGAAAIVGDACSGGMLALASTANQLHVPVVSPSATNPDITTAGDYIFRVIPSDDLAANFTANLLYGKGIKRLAIINGNEPYGNGLNTALTAAFTKLGGTVVASEKIVNEDPNVSAQMARIKAAKPDALYIAFNGSTLVPVAILQQAKNLGLSVPIYSSETLKDPIFVKDAGALAEGLTTIAVSDGSPSYVEQFKAAYNKNTPDIYSAQAYDAYTAIFKALQSGATTGPQIKNALYKVDFTGASGHVVFDQNGDVPANYIAFKITDGAFVAQASK